MKNKYSLLSQLIQGQLSGELDESQFQLLHQMLSKDPENLVYYIEYTTLWALLDEAGGFQNAGAAPEFDTAMMEALAEEERTAPSIDIPAVPKEPAVDEGPPEIRKVRPKVSKFSIYSLLLSSAAMIFVIVYAQFISMKRGVEVATLMDSIDAKWADLTGPMEKGTRLLSGRDSLQLREGLAELRFDNQTRIVIEGPAEFELHAGDQILLRHGRLYATVPQEATGFMVNTPYARIIDLGTEFGVISNTSGDTEVHVFRGKTVLVGGGQKEKKSVLNLTAGNAGIVCDNGATIKTIPHASHAFIQKIDSRSGFVWKGESAILLTHLLAGHLFSADPQGIEIDPATGEYVIHENYVSGAERQGGIEYRKMNSPFVNGSFIPQGQQPQIISSTGLSYRFPKTSGRLHFNLSDQETVYDTKTSTNYPLLLEPSYQEQSSLFLHPNMGVTFDLNKIRKQLPTLQIQRFVTDCGIAFSVREALKKAYPDGNIPDEEKPSVDFTVLLDGKVSEILTGINLDSGVLKIDVEIRPTDQFLTLVSTDGNQSFKYDWFVLAQPELKIGVSESTSTESKSMNP